MKKFITVFLICILCISATGCAVKLVPSGNNDQSSAASDDSKPKELTPTELEQLLREQPCYVESTNYIVQDTVYKALHPDLLSAVIKNASGTDIKEATIVFAAWGENNFPVKICGQFSSNDDYFACTVYEDANMVNGATYGQNYDLPLDDTEQAKIKTFKAIVTDYTDFDGSTWENPYFSAWYSLYYNKKLS